LSESDNLLSIAANTGSRLDLGRRREYCLRQLADGSIQGRKRLGGMMKSQTRLFGSVALDFISSAALLYGLHWPSHGIAQGITFSVGPDETLNYPSTLTDLADEHTTIFPPAPGSNAYRFFASSAVKGASGGPVVLETTDLTNFSFASGYSTQVMKPAIPFTSCKTVYDPEFDLNYAAPGSVVQDPTLPPGNLIMIYEAENHCPGAVWQQEFYATVGFARSADDGKTWPAVVDAELGGTNRYPVLKNPTPQPTTSPATPQAIGNAIPSAIAVTNSNGDSYLYVVYVSPGPGADGMLRIARAKLGVSGPIGFLKWYKGTFTEPGLGGRDSGVLPSRGCTGRQGMPQISYSDTLGLYVMVFVCPDVQTDSTGVTQTYQASWYFSTATSLDLQNWTPPQLIANSQFPLVNGCAPDGSGQSFDGWYPSLMSPGVPAGHISNTGNVFYMDGCDTGGRVYKSRSFTITAPAPAASGITASAVASGTKTKLTLFGLVSVPASTVCAAQQVWVAVNVPQLHSLLFLTPTGFATAVGNAFPSYVSGPGVVTFPLVSSLNLTGYEGTTVYTGYGCDVPDLLSRQQYKAIYTVQ
jgi:hypothetical protein